jgi:hypothetical protein
MAQDDKVIGTISPAELLDVMRGTGMIVVQETGTVENKPVIHAALKLVHAQTGEELPGGLPFSVVMFKGAAEPGYSNIAIGTVVPAAELEITLPENFFNLCNQRFRFIRAFPLDASSFVLQMDLFLRNTTPEYIKFSFGLWGALFSQVLFELMGRGTQSLSRAAEVYAATPKDIISRYEETVAAAPPAEDTPIDEAALVELPADPFAAAPESDAVKESEPGPNAEPVSEADASIAPSPAADESPAEVPTHVEEASEATPAAKEVETVPA